MKSRLQVERTVKIPHFGKYAGVVQDVFDHFFAINWTDYHQESLNEYTRFIYVTLELTTPFLMKELLRTFHYMQMQDWLGTMLLKKELTRAYMTIAQSRLSF